MRVLDRLRLNVKWVLSTCGSRGLGREMARAIADAGAEVDSSDYDRAQQLADGCRRQTDGLLQEIDLLLTPAALGEAPRDRTQTGDFSANTLWTALHTPCVTLPRARGPRGLPLGIQMVARRGADAALLAHARWIEEV